jgi:hypothetical protein
MLQSQVNLSEFSFYPDLRVIFTASIAGLQKKQHNWQALLLMVLKKFPMAHQIALLVFPLFLLGN